MALTITQRDVFLEAPELECNVIASDVMANAIAQVALEVNVGAVSTLDRANRLAVLLVCHRLTLYKQRASGVGAIAQAVGPLASVSVGGVSKSFASASEGLSGDNAKTLSNTAYGKEFARLARLWTIRGGVS